MSSDQLFLMKLREKTILFIEGVVTLYLVKWNGNKYGLQCQVKLIILDV